jgi:hypothetical protein
MKLLATTMFIASASYAMATTVIVTNNRGPTATREIVNSSATLVAGFGAFGTLTESGIQGVSTTFSGLNFKQFGLGGGGVTTSTSGQFSFTGDVGPAAPNAADFLTKNIYLVVGFGGANLASSTELFIYRFNQTFGDLNSPTPITQTLTAAGSEGVTLFGTEIGNPQTTASGRFAASAITPIPEPSAALLGALGALGLLRRRRI